jgi:hypothetical protein
MTRARVLADYVAGGSTAAEFDVLDGLTSTTAELNHVDGVTSNVQTQLNAKLPLAGGTMTGNIVMGDDTSIGIGDSAERIEFDGAGDISVLGANLGVGTDAPGAILDVRGQNNTTQAIFSGTAGRGLKISTTNPESQNNAGVIYDAQDTESGGVGTQAWAIGGNTKMTLDKSGNVSISTGDLTVTGSGKGIGFGSEIMDDYEEFSWSPGLRTGSYTHYNWSYTVKGVKIGRLVHITMYGTGTATGSAGADSLYAAAALPYAASSTSPPIMLGVGTGGSGFGHFHNTYSNALGSGATVPAHSSGTTFNFSMNLTYYTDS